MAIYGQQQTKQYSTTEDGMMIDAKEYAKKDYQIVLATMRKFNTTGIISDEEIAQALISVKYAQIVEARTKRVSYFD